MQKIKKVLIFPFYYVMIQKRKSEGTEMIEFIFEKISNDLENFRVEVP